MERNEYTKGRSIYGACIYAGKNTTSNKCIKFYAIGKEKAVRCCMNNLVSENINIEFWSKGYDIAAKNVHTIAEYIANQLRKEQ